MKKQINIFLTAVMFYTRIPCPSNINHSAEMLNKSTQYFPVVGWLIGGISASIYWGLSLILPDSLAIILSMIASILLTGAFHEDGFSDVCDGFGGGWTKEDRLRIMKDSRIGVYGGLGLLLMVFTKYLLLQEVSVYFLPFSLIAAHTTSRLIPVIVIFYGTYSRDDLTSKVRPIGKKISIGGFIFAILTGVLPLLLFRNVWFLLVLVLPVAIGLFLMRYFKKRIDGYTGDCLGAIQQVSEIAVYLSILLVYMHLV